MKSSRYPLVSIITVNFNQSKVTCDLLSTLKEINYPNIEVIVVDNHSTNDDPSIIAELYPEVQLVLSDKNLGFAGGNNIGIDHSKGDYILFLNNDIEVSPDFLEPLVKAFNCYANVGLVSPKIKFYYRHERIQYAGYTPLTSYTLRNELIGFNQVDDGRFDTPLSTAYAHGAGMMISREVLNIVGKLPEVYFLYYEEIDWSVKVKSHGFNIYYIPQSVIYHKESVSTGRKSSLKSYYFVRNRFLFARRNLHGLRKYISFIYQILISLPKMVLTHIFHGEFNNVIACLKGLLWNFEHPFNHQIN